MKSIAVIGLGRFGTALAYSLRDEGIEVQAIDVNPDEIEDLQASDIQLLQFDSRDKSQLKRNGVHESDVVVVAIGENFQAAQETVLALKELGAKSIIARAQTEDRRRILLMIGANKVISPEEQSAIRIAQSLTHPMASEIHDMGGDVQLATIKVPVAFDGQSLRDLHPTLSEAGAIVIRVTRANPGANEDPVIMPPGANTVLNAGDDITLVAKFDKIKHLASL